MSTVLARSAQSVTARVLDDYAALGAADWAMLLHRSPAATVFGTREWVLAWDDAFARGGRLLVVAERAGEPVAAAAWFHDGGMVFPAGVGTADYLDLLGDTDDPAVVEALLATAAAAVPGFVGFRLFQVPSWSPTSQRLAAAADRLGLRCVAEGELPVPMLDLSAADALHRVLHGTSLRRHERTMRRDGELVVRQVVGADVAAAVPLLADLHVRRWADTPFPSSLADGSPHRDFLDRLATRAADSGWLRLTRVDWDGRLVAAHLGTCFGGRYLWYKPAFEIELARRSPGEVLLRQLLLEAVEERATVFDFGIGDEAFKHRFATDVATVTTWGLYP